MTMGLHHLAPVKVGASTNIAAVTNLTVSPAAQELVLRNGGEVDPSFVGAIAADPRVMFSSQDLAALLVHFGTSQYSVVDGTHTLESYLYAVEEFGTRKTGANHKKSVVTKGMLVPRTVSADQDQVATMECECVCGYDGTNQPIAISSSVSLPTVAMIEPYTLGPVKINNVTQEGMRRLSVDHGWNIQSYREAGNTFPTVLYATTREPRITLSGFNTDKLETFGILGSPLNTTAVFYFRKVKDGGGVYANNLTQHISLTVYGNVIPGGPSGASDNPLEADLTFLPRKGSGGQPAMTWAVGVAIA